MSESLEQLKVIRDGAPDGAEYVSICGNAYARFENNVFLQYVNGQWVNTRESIIYSRLLSDANRIIDLTEALLLINDLSLVTGDEGMQKHIDNLLMERDI